MRVKERITPILIVTRLFMSLSTVLTYIEITDMECKKQISDRNEYGK